jgi:hypothetical protein
MGLSDDDIDLALRVIKRMMSKGVTGQHHKQAQTIAGWFATHEQGDVKDVLDDMASDINAPVREKGRGTYQLTGISSARDFLNDHGDDYDPSGW